MTKKQLQKKTRSLIFEASKHMRKNIDRAINSGSIDVSSWDNNWLLPKLLLNALLMEEQHQYAPPAGMNERQYKKQIESIYACI